MCPECGRTQIPPREICAICRVRVHEFVELGPKGTVTNFDIVYFASPDPLTGAVRDTPYTPIYIVLDGASEQDAFAFELKKEDIDRIKVVQRFDRSGWTNPSGAPGRYSTLTWTDEEREIQDMNLQTCLKIHGTALYWKEKCPSEINTFAGRLGSNSSSP